ncbi:SufD family Fe-S cluster assembly protein [bacterium]|nr:SufD family Fe-S cluster assembly protein [bacterium]
MDIDQIYKAANLLSTFHDPEAPKLSINLNRVVDSQLTKGLDVDTRETESGVDVQINIQKGVVISRPVHLCFGVTDEQAVQRIKMDIHVEEGAQIQVMAHCVFPQAVDVKHLMDAVITLEKNARYSYLERHIHSQDGGISVIPNARIHLGENARFRTDFELIQGRVGLIDMNYETICAAGSVMEMTAKINGTHDDIIRIHETGHLNGQSARGVLTTKVAVRDRAKAEVHNKLTASAPKARGHVDCKEIIQDQGTAVAIPIVEVNHPKAHVTHEASIGSVDSRQLQTLMARGLSEDDAVELIIQGLLS